MPLERPASNLLTIWGDHFSADTRTILSAIKVANASFGGRDPVPYSFHCVDQFQAVEPTREELLKVNPTGLIPTVVQGRQVIIGSNIAFL